MAIREGRWDCSCGHCGNRGPVRNCAGCGRPRGKDVKFYLPEDAPAVTDPEALRKAKAGADRTCEHCQSDNPADAQNCIGCGASLVDGDPEREVIDYGLGDTPRSGTPILPLRRDSAARRESLQRAPWWQYPLIGGGIIFFVLIAIFVFKTHEEPVTAVGFLWERSVAIEAYRTVHEEDWDVPTGGRLTGEHRAIHHYDKVIDHYRDVPKQVQTGTKRVKCGTRDLGNGHFEDKMCDEPVYTKVTEKEAVYRDEPVHRTKYEYDIERWVAARTDRSRGSDQKPYWPESDLASNERQAGRGEKYSVLFQDQKGQTYNFDYPEPQWKNFGRGKQYAGTFSVFGSLRDVKM